MTKASNKQIGILYLPENVIRELFLYLSYKEIYFSIRKTCLLFSKYVDNYIQIGGVFLLVTGVAKWDILQLKRPPCKIVYALKRNQRLVTIICKDIPSLPKPDTQRIVNDFQFRSYEEIACFGGLIKQRIVAGYFCKEHWAGPASGGFGKHLSRVSGVFNPHGSHATYKSTYMLVPYVYEYQSSRNMWVPITTVNTRLKSLEFRNDIVCHLSHCPAEDSIIFKLDICCSTYIDSSGNNSIMVEDDALVLLKFEISSANENGNDIVNGTILRYTVKVLSLPNKLVKSKKIQRRRQLITSNFPSVFTLSKNSGIIMFLHNGNTKRMDHKDLARLNLTYEMTPWIGSPGSSYRCKGFILQNKIYIVRSTGFKAPPLYGARNETQLLFSRYDLNNKKSSVFSRAVPCSIINIQEAVTNTEGTFSMILAHMQSVQKFDVPTSSNCIEITGIELGIFVFTESLELQYGPKLQGHSTHEIFHTGVCFDDPDISYPGACFDAPFINHISKSTLLRIS